MNVKYWWIGVTLVLVLLLPGVLGNAALVRQQRALNAIDESIQVSTDKSELEQRGDNHPPNPPVITGPTTGRIWKKYTYNVTVFDPDGDNLNELRVEIEEKMGLIGMSILGNWTSGDTIPVSIRWLMPGTYTIKARVKDVHGAWSNWTTLRVSMPKNMGVFPLLFYGLLEERHIPAFFSDTAGLLGGWVFK